MKTVHFALVLVFAGIIGVGCKKKSKVECNGTSPTYTSFVQQLVSNNCIGCHSEYNNYNAVKAIVDNGNFEEEVISSQRMPQGGSLADEELSALKCWIENGAPEN